MKISRNILSVLIMISIALVSCKKEDADNTDIITPSLTTDLSGFGNRTGTPSGTTYSLPEEIQLIGQIEAVEPYTSPNIYPSYGLGTILTYMTLSNTAQNSSIINFPAGLVFLPDNDSSQTVISLRPIELIIQANDSVKIEMLMFCTNKYKNAMNANYYTMDVVSNNDQITKLINELKYKSDSLLIPHTAELGDIVHHITDGDGLSQEDLDSINSWQN